MTVQNTTVKDIYVGNGATTKFPITFQMTDHPEYIKVYITGDDSVAVETENFSVDLGAKTVTYPANGDPLPEGHKITIYRELPVHQLMNLVNQGPFFAENIELSLDDLIFICQQLNEKLNRTLSAGIDVSNFNNTFPVKAGMSFRINDAGDGLVLTEDPARVLPLAKEVLEQTKQVKESAVNETTEIKDEAVAAKNTAVEAAATAAKDAVNDVQTLLDEQMAATENAKRAAASSAESALASKNAAAASQESAAASATTATREANRAQEIAGSIEGLAGVAGVATTAEAIAGVVDNKAMTPLKTKEAIEQGTNVFTASNAFRANITVSNGTAAGSQGQIVLGVKPSTATVQANITSSTTGALNYNATETTGHYFKIGNNIATTSITSNESETAIFSHNAFEFARITNAGVAKWMGNANTATKLETPRAINGVPFDGTRDIYLDSNPVGTIIAMSYTGVPAGYLHCNGAAVNRATYVNLFHVIGTAYGPGDGITTFNLPNTVARFLEGGLGASVFYEAGLPNITGNISAFRSSIGGAFVGSVTTNRYDGWADNEDEFAISTSFDASRCSRIYGASVTVQPPAMTVVYCIKY